MDDLSLATLSDKELLQAFVPERSAVALLKEYQNVYNVVMESSEPTMSAVPGLGNAKVKKLLLIRELVHRVNDVQRKAIKSIRNPGDAIAYFNFLKDRPQEEMWVLLLNTKHHIIGSKQVSVGTINATLVEPREVFKPAISRLAAAVIVAHCHPSGDCSASPEDRSTTQRLAKSGQLLNIQLLDHIIIGKYGSCSLRENTPQLFMGGM